MAVNRGYGYIESAGIGIDLSNNYSTKSIKISILDVYSGEKYNDTCISGIRVLAKP